MAFVSLAHMHLLPIIPGKYGDEEEDRWKALCVPKRNALAVMPIVCAMRRLMGVSWVNDILEVGCRFSEGSGLHELLIRKGCGNFRVFIKMLL